MLVSVRALFLTPEWSIAWALISMKRLAAHHAVWGVEGYLKVSQRPVQWRSARESAGGRRKEPVRRWRRAARRARPSSQPLGAHTRAVLLLASA